MGAAQHPQPLALIDSAAPDATRQTSIAAATKLITSLLNAVVWLISQRFSVISFHGSRDIGGDKIVIKVAPSPRLHVVFGDDCAWRQRRQDGALTIYTWFADRFGVRIEWEEVTCL